MIRRERRFAPGRAWAGKLDELERTSGLLTPRRWLIWWARATRRQSQTKLCQSFMNRTRRGVEAIRTEVTRPAVNLTGDLWRRRKQRWSEFIHSKSTVRAGVLELGHGAWRHEMGMGDGDRRACSSPGARALVWQRSRAAKSKAAGTLCLPLQACLRARHARARLLDQRPVKTSPSASIDLDAMYNESDRQESAQRCFLFYFFFYLPIITVQGSLGVATMVTP